jgi:hypothetical protein
MMVSEKTLKWALCFYPPLFFQRIWVKKFHTNFRGVDVKISNSFLNRNFNGSIFGGTIYAATDPFYAILFDQLMQRSGFKVRVWLKSASIQYLKPGLTDLYFSIHITDEMVLEAEKSLNKTGKFVKAYPIELYNKKGELCAIAMNEVYLRNKFPGENQEPVAI